MPRATSASSGTRRRSTRGRSATGSIVAQITQLIATNDALRHENAELLAVNEQLRTHLMEIGSTLGRLTGGSRRGRRGADPAAFVDAQPKRQRRPITDPVLLERRRQALAKARAARAERLKAAKEGTLDVPG